MKNKTHTKEEVKGRIKKIKNMATENMDTDKLRKGEKDIVDLARKCIQDSRDQNISNKKRTVLLEDALRLLITLGIKAGDKLNSLTFTAIAEAYLLRSRIFRPKCVNVPEKKKESINKGITFAKKAISLDPVNTEAWRIKGHLLLELERIDEDAVKKEELKNDLESAIKNGCTDFNNAEDISIVLRFAELTNNTEYATLISKSGLKEIELEKARACKVINDENGIKGNMNGVIKRLYDLSFSDPLWEDTVNFLKLLKMPGNGCWKELSSGVYEACLHREKKTALLPLRWYWSRLNDLYDLAFLAANSPKEKAQIADTSKSRPSLRYTVWEDVCKKDPARRSEYTAVMENEGMSGYVKNIKSQVAVGEDMITELVRLVRMQRKIVDIPDDCKDLVVIHFYLNNLEGKGYALIYDKEWQHPKEFQYNELFKYYLIWQTKYNLFPREFKSESAGDLVKLCRKIGDAMLFLFNISSNKPVVFVPHDFLSRLPLHAAIKKDSDEVFLQNHPCCYLPAWSSIPKRDTVNNTQRILFRNFSDYEYPQLLKRQWDYIRKENEISFDDFHKIHLPEFFVMLCHGKADPVNPFNSRLKITEQGITYIEMSRLDMKLAGSRLVLGACETDMTIPLNSTIDEHVSISNILLTKGAKTIVSTMWQADPAKIEKIVDLIYPRGTDLVTAINKWQKDLILNWQKKNPSLFYECVVFRMIGGI